MKKIQSVYLDISRQNCWNPHISGILRLYTPQHYMYPTCSNRQEMMVQPAPPIRSYIWVASRNWSMYFIDLTCLLKKCDTLCTFHYFFFANQKCLIKMVATCSSHRCGPKITVKFLRNVFWKYFFRGENVRKYFGRWVVIYNRVLLMILGRVAIYNMILLRNLIMADQNICTHFHREKIFF